MSITSLFLCLSFFGGGGCDIDWSEWPEVRDVLSLSVCTENTMLVTCVTADAGPDFMTLPNVTVQLDGSNTFVPNTPGAAMFSWTQIDNGAPSVTLNGADTDMPSFIAPAGGFYEFQMDVGWLCFADSDTITVEIDLSPPSQIEATLLTPISGEGPVQVISPPGDPRRFIVGKRGHIHIYNNGMLLPTPYLDISGLVSSGSEQGLLGLAFDPDYATNGFFYVNYTGRRPDGTGNTSDTRIVAYQVDSGNPNFTDPNDNQLLLEIDQGGETNHNGGQLLFGPDGYLYIGMGDGGGGGDNHGAIGNGQNLQTLLGKMLRIGVDGFNPYTIPPDNPFVTEGTALPEIWAYGLRNPWRFSFDRATGDIYIGDVGQNNWEEIDFQPFDSTGGENYGWRLMEGNHCFNPSTNCDPGGLTDPVAEYSHSFGCSVTGGFVYRGSDVPGLTGFYIYADYCSGIFWTLFDGPSGWEVNDLEVLVNGSPLSANILGFGQDSDGELYICTGGQNGGNVYMITGIP